MPDIVAGRITESEMLAAGRTLARAFQNDPLQVHVFPDAEERAQRSVPQFSALVREGYLYGEVFTTTGITGVSIWMPPKRVSTAEHASQSGFAQLPRVMGNEAFMRFARVLDYLTDVHGRGIPAEYWYLVAVGVQPEQQGRGLGQALLKPIMVRADADGVPICLDTAQPKVRVFYERLGFKSAIESVDPRSGLRFWTYQRDPARKDS